jgi:hypothetical protein
LIRAYQHVKGGCLSLGGKQREDSLGMAYLTSLVSISKRRLFITKQGYLGILDATAAPGDSVVVLWGLEMPFVFQSIKGGQYRIVGEAYLHGMIDAELLEKQPTVVTFTIC